MSIQTEVISRKILDNTFFFGRQNGVNCFNKYNFIYQNINTHKDMKALIVIQRLNILIINKGLVDILVPIM